MKRPTSSGSRCAASRRTSCAPALTMLGILIGVGAVILLVAVGNGSAQADPAEHRGAWAPTRSPYSAASSARGLRRAIRCGARTRPYRRRGEGARRPGHGCPDVKSVSPGGRRAGDRDLRGSDHDRRPVRRHLPELLRGVEQPGREGTCFTDDDVRRPQGRGDRADRRRGALRQRRPDRPVRSSINGIMFTVVGVLAEKGSTGFNDPNDIAIAPLTARAAGADRLRRAHPDPRPGDVGRRRRRRAGRGHRDPRPRARRRRPDEFAVPDPQPVAAARNELGDDRDVHRAARRGRRDSACSSAASASPTS